LVDLSYLSVLKLVKASDQNHFGTLKPKSRKIDNQIVSCFCLWISVYFPIWDFSLSNVVIYGH